MAKKSETKKYTVLAPPQPDGVVPGTYGATPGNTGWSHGGNLYVQGTELELTDEAAAPLLEADIVILSSKSTEPIAVPESSVSEAPADPPKA